MTRVSRMIEASRSGPDLYISSREELINLGIFYCLIDEVSSALQIVSPAIDDILEDGFAEKVPMALAARLALDYATDCLNALFPDKTVNGVSFKIDSGKVVLEDKPVKGGAA